jgi:6-phosphogluconate dehydrogenase
VDPTDEAQQKGTGKWTSQHAFDIGAPIPTINAAVESRILSALKAERVHASHILHGPSPHYHGKKDGSWRPSARRYASKVTSYAQGFGLLRWRRRSGYGLQAEHQRIWRAGCIIRATLLDDITSAYRRNPGLPNLLMDEAFRDAVERRQDSWRFIVQTAVGLGIPALAMSASLAYFDAYRSERLPANLTQAQRDCFGAHTYRRVDKPGVFHTKW